MGQINLIENQKLRNEKKVEKDFFELKEIGFESVKNWEFYYPWNNLSIIERTFGWKNQEIEQIKNIYLKNDCAIN